MKGPLTILLKLSYNQFILWIKSLPILVIRWVSRVWGSRVVYRTRCRRFRMLRSWVSLSRLEGSLIKSWSLLLNQLKIWDCKSNFSHLILNKQLLRLIKMRQFKQLVQILSQIRTRVLPPLHSAAAPYAPKLLNRPMLKMQHQKQPTAKYLIW